MPLPPSHPHFGPTRVLARTVALINAAGPPASSPVTAERVRAVLRDHGEPDVAVDARELAPLSAILDDLYAACTADSDAGVAAALNRLLGAHAHPPRLTDHDGTRWHLHVDSRDDAGLHEWVAASGALALALTLSESGRAAWGVCRAEGCGRVFTRSGPRRRRTACSDRCASRARVRAHRARFAHRPDPATDHRPDAASDAASDAA